MNSEETASPDLAGLVDDRQFARARLSTLIPFAG